VGVKKNEIKSTDAKEQTSLLSSGCLIESRLLMCCSGYQEWSFADRKQSVLVNFYVLSPDSALNLCNQYSAVT